MSWRLVLDPVPIETAGAVVDVTRLLGARRRAAGTGVDRIDLAVARELADRLGTACAFVAATPAGPALLAGPTALRLIAALDRRWRGEDAMRDVQTLPHGPELASALAAGRLWIAAGRLRRRIAAGATYVNASHAGLPIRPGMLARLDPDGRMKRLIYVHDLIPLDYPEYQTPGAVDRFACFLAEAARRSTRFLTNTVDTARRLAAHAAAQGWPVEGIDVLTPRLARSGEAPAHPRLRASVRAILEDVRLWFVTIGTIEPRKNHLLLLHLWRSMAKAGRTPPLLVVIGRRGWENEMVVDLLDRCASLRPHLVELGNLDDGEAMALLAGARALLMPSFAEGLGVPVLEAAAVRTQVIASDLPALREIAPPGTVFLDPLDGAAWLRAILARAAPMEATA